MAQRNCWRAGFSLTELLSALAVLLLVGLVLPGLSERGGDAVRAQVHAHFDLLARALDAHFVDTGCWPFEPAPSSTHEPTALAGLFRNETGLAGWAGPYLAAELETAYQGTRSPGEAGAGGLRDPWGRAYGLRRIAPGEREGALILWSGGPNGILDTDLRDLRAGRAGGDDLVRRIARLY
jgi:hypothetical protein